ncbi:MAG: ATP-binding cassette domain-containing protein [Actinomycetota bacterium]|nr:ATP-binding cassette domain-containing protein [Actinomycetota bacterium]
MSDLAGPGMSAKPAFSAIEVRDLQKSYGHVQALRGASLEVSSREVVALVGDNGAGKSTLLKCICGAVVPDAGEVLVNGVAIAGAGSGSPSDHGIGVVYQDLALAPHLSVLENVFLGHEVLRPGWRRRLGVLERRSMADRADESLRRLGIALPTTSLPVSLLSGGQRQAVAIARAVMWAKGAILLDEPTAALGARQTKIVCDLVRAVADQGTAVLMISHDITRIREFADRIVVMRQGGISAEFRADVATVAGIVQAMLEDSQHAEIGVAGRRA